MGGAQTPTPKEQPPGGAETFPEAVVKAVEHMQVRCERLVEAEGGQIEG